MGLAERRLHFAYLLCALFLICVCRATTLSKKEVHLNAYPKFGVMVGETLVTFTVVMKASDAPSVQENALVFDVTEDFGDAAHVCSVVLTPSEDARSLSGHCMATLNPSMIQDANSIVYKAIYRGSSISSARIAISLSKYDKKRQTVSTGSTTPPIDNSTTTPDISTTVVDTTTIDPTATTDTSVPTGTDTTTVVPTETTDIPTVPPEIIDAVDTSINSTDPNNITAVDALSTQVGDLLANPGMDDTAGELMMQNFMSLLLDSSNNANLTPDGAQAIIDSMSNVLTNDTAEFMSPDAMIDTLDSLDGLLIPALSTGPLDAAYDTLSRIYDGMLLAQDRLDQNGSFSVDLALQLLDILDEMLLAGLNRSGNVSMIGKFFGSVGFAGNVGLLFEQLPSFVDPPANVGLNENGNLILTQYDSDYLPDASKNLTEEQYRLLPNNTGFSLTATDKAGNDLNVRFTDADPIIFTYPAPKKADGSSYIDVDELARLVFPCGYETLSAGVLGEAEWSSTPKCSSRPRYVCGYLNVTTKVWARDGCAAVSVSLSSLKCGCTHLTTFGVLIDPKGGGKKKKKSKVGLIAGVTVGVIAAITIAVILGIYFYTKRHKRTQSFGSSGSSRGQTL